MKLDNEMKIGVTVCAVMLTLCACLFVVGLRACSHEISKAGGIKKVIIKSGKEIKDINRQINADDTPK